MLTIKAKSEKKCFICGSVDKTVDVAFADKSFRGVLCLTHVHEKLKPEAKNAQGLGGGKTS
jgi:hypothetical protein